MKYIVSILLFSMALNVVGQDDVNNLPYHELPDYSEEFTAGTVAARMVDALGFRFYWATDGLLESDLQFRPNEDGRDIKETIKHVHGLSTIILNSTLKIANVRGEEENLSFEQIRKETLMNLKTAADIMRESSDISQFQIIFSNSQGESSFPFWNQINGPIADSIWHCGQIAMMRRTAGNPFNGNVNQFTGKVKQ